MSHRRKIRLFLDSNVFISGIVSGWGLDKAALSLCAAQVCKLVLAEVVRDEVEESLLLQAQRSPLLNLDNLVVQYHKRVQLARPEIIPYPPATAVHTKRYLIRHMADVPVVLSAVAARPDWLLTHNTKHFTKSVANRTGLRIATPALFFQALCVSLR